MSGALRASSIRLVNHNRPPHGSSFISDSQVKSHEPFTIAAYSTREDQIAVGSSTLSIPDNEDALVPTAMTPGARPVIWWHRDEDSKIRLYSQHLPSAYSEQKSDAAMRLLLSASEANINRELAFHQGRNSDVDAAHCVVWSLARIGKTLNEVGGHPYPLGRLQAAPGALVGVCRSAEGIGVSCHFLLRW